MVEDSGNSKLSYDHSICAGHFVVSIHEALQRARKLNLDLVEVNLPRRVSSFEVIDIVIIQMKFQMR